jgi:hypothetical protein
VPVPFQVFLVLAPLAAHLNGDEDADHADDDPDPHEGGEQAYVLADGCACGEKHRVGSLATQAALVA